MEDNYTTVSVDDFFEVKTHRLTHQNALYCHRAFKKGENLISFLAEKTVTHPNYLTVQIGNQKHIHLRPSFLQFINHSCDPNIIFNTSSMQLGCLKDISIGEELCFFYPATEWEISQPFDCNCNSEKCLKRITGAAFMSPDILSRYTLTNFIQEQLKINTP